jgi:hypothetical protein
MNGLPALASNLASYGRNGDSMLVHMTPGEVNGLQALALAHGGSLSINPDTGLVEANFLKRLLPTLAGAALMIGSGGAINPLTAGMIVGGVEGLRTGDLGKGFMAGLGAYGGAGIGAGLTAAGSQAAAANAAQTVAAQPAASYAGGNLAGTVAPTVGQNFATAGQGLQALGTEAGRDAFLGQAATATTPATGIGGFGGLTKAGLATAAPFMVQEPTAMPGPATEESNYAGPYTPSERRVRYPTEEERRRLGTGEFTYFTPSNPIPFADGGSAPMLEEGGFVLTKKAVDGLGKGDNKKGQAAAQAGLGAIPIKGKGTGTSDSIRTTIAGRQPALVSNGEAYVPARKVKENGGAKAFYALMRGAEKAA